MNKFFTRFNKVYKKATQASEALQPYFKESKGTQGSVAAFLQDSPSKKFFSYELLNSRKQRTFYATSYLQGQWKYRKAKEAVESAKAGLTLLRRAWES